MTQQFYVSGIFETVGAKFNVNIGCDGMEADLCYGVVIASQQTVTQFLTKHKGLYNYLMLDDIIDGIPTIRLIRRAVNTDLAIDAVVKQADCIVQGNNSPAIHFKRVDPMSLPRTVEVQYISFDRGFAVNTQYAHNDGAKTQQAILSVQSDFILDDATARELAYDMLFRMWQQQLTISFEHPDLTIEPADIVQVNADNGSFVIQVLTSMITKEPMDSSGIGRTNQLSGQLLLTRRGVTVNPGQINTSSSSANFHINSRASVVFVGSTLTRFVINGTSTFAAVGNDGSDPFWTDVVFLDGFEGSNGSTGAPGLTDESPSAHGTGTVAGAAQIATAQHKFGSSSLSLASASSSKVSWPDSADWHFGTGMFTIECFFRANAVSSAQFLVVQWTGTSATDLAWALWLNSTSLAFNISTVGTDNQFLLGGGTVSTGAWHHAAVDYDGTNYRLYLDGTRVAVTPGAANLFDSSQNMTIGGSGGGNFYFDGYIDEVRITKNIARYATDAGFTVPTAPFPRY